MVFLEHRSVAVHTPNLNRRVLLLKVLGHPRNGAACSHTHNKVRDFTFGLFPNLRPRRLVMRLAVAEVVVLVGEVGVGDLRIQTPRHRIVAVGVVGGHVGGADVDFCAERPQYIHFLLALLVAEGADEFVAFDNGCEREAHAGVAGGAFNDGAAGLEQTVFLGIFDHFQGHTVLGAVSGVEVFHFGVHGSGNAFHGFVQLDQWCTANGFQNVLVDGRRLAGCAHSPQR